MCHDIQTIYLIFIPTTSTSLIIIIIATINKNPRRTTITNKNTQNLSLLSINISITYSKFNLYLTNWYKNIEIISTVILVFDCCVILDWDWIIGGVVCIGLLLVVEEGCWFGWEGYC